MAEKRPSSVEDTVYQLMITLCPYDFIPPIWRRILIPAIYTLDDLHRAIQSVFGWDNSHLHVFECKGVYYSQPYMDVESTEDENDVQIAEVMPRIRSKIIYIYDFGDDWQHFIQLEKKLKLEPKTFYPVCLGGELAAPPEDCGGVPGYLSLCEAMENPEHPESEFLSTWLRNAPFDPKAFDLNKINNRLRKLK